MYFGIRETLIVVVVWRVHKSDFRRSRVVSCVCPSVHITACLFVHICLIPEARWCLKWPRDVFIPHTDIWTCVRAHESQTNSLAKATFWVHRSTSGVPVSSTPMHMSVLDVLETDQGRHILAKVVDLRINLNIGDTPIVSRSHTHLSHSQTSCLLTFSHSLHRHSYINILFRSESNIWNLD